MRQRPPKFSKAWHACSIIGIILGLLLLLSACAPGTGILGGGTWQSTGLQQGQQIRTLEVNPQNPQQIYAGDAHNGVYRSTDAGADWKASSVGLPLPVAIQALSFDDNGKNLYAATDKGLFISNNDAQSWQQANTASSHLPGDSYTSLTFDSNHPQNVYVGTAVHGIWMSTDNGVTWTQISSGLPDGTVNNLAYDPVQHRLWAVVSSVIYYTDSHGHGWQRAMTGIPTQTAVNIVTPAADSGGPQGLLYAGTNHGFYRSQDDGARWTASTQDLYALNIYTLLVDFRGSNGASVYAGTSIGAFRSDDSGEDWRAIASGIPRGAAVYAMVIGATNDTQLYAASNDVYVYPGTSGGVTPANLLPWLIVLLLFGSLIFITSRNRRRRAFRRQQRTQEDQDKSEGPPTGTS